MTQLQSIETLQRRTLHEELVERLRDILIEGTFIDSDKIPEKALCEQLGVSRTPMREALKVLASDGLITLVPNRGAVFRGITMEELNNLFPVIGAMEALAGELACQQMNEKDYQKIQKLHDKMFSAYERKDLQAYFKLNRKIHESIFACAGNDILTAQYEQLSNRLRRARYQANMSEQRWMCAMREHEDMMTAMKQRDGRKLATILKAHLQQKHETLLEKLTTEPIP